jgi:hypothetical protein
MLPSWRPCSIPVIAKYCGDDEVLQFGRSRLMNIPWYMVESLIARAANYSPRTPLSVSGEKGAGTLSLDIALTDAVLPAQGNDYLFPGFMLEISTSDNVAPGVSTASIHGVFEDGQEWTQDVQFSQGHVGVSRFLVFGSRTEQGSSYPSLFRVSQGLLLTEIGGAIVLTPGAAPNDATSATPTNGIRAIERQFSVDVTEANLGTAYRIELLTPVGRFWDWMGRTLLEGAPQP